MAVHPSLNVYVPSAAWQEDQLRPHASSVRQAMENQSQMALVVKAFASCAVCSEQCVIRGAKDLTDFFDKTLKVKSAIESNIPMLN